MSTQCLAPALVAPRPASRRVTRRAAAVVAASSPKSAPALLSASLTAAAQLVLTAAASAAVRSRGVWSWSERARLTLGLCPPSESDSFALRRKVAHSCFPHRTQSRPRRTSPWPLKEAARRSSPMLPTCSLFSRTPCSTVGERTRRRQRRRRRCSGCAGLLVRPRRRRRRRLRERSCRSEHLTVTVVGIALSV